VYRLHCRDTKKEYVGSCSASDFIYVRLIHHRNDLRQGKHQNKYLQRVYNKYGEASFFVDILEECDPTLCISREQYWIDTLKPHYNLCKKAGSSLGRACKEETKTKISVANKKWFQEHPEFKEKLSTLAKGRKISEGHRRKMNEGKLRKRTSSES